ncbi:MAG TPA: radical SAM protein [Candidatus Angelobacter sp.]|jgi:hypothetical protein|nr:radical SAM protein [Candidatus Angelobacter sp.]
MNITFIHPPLDDPTIPYHSTAYLRGNLLKNGFTNVRTRDLNVEFVNYCLEEDVIKSFYQDIEHKINEYGRKRSLTFTEQEDFYSLWAGPGMLEPSAPRQAAAALRSRERFTEYESYVANVKCLRQHFKLLGTLCHPAEISDFKIKSRGRYSIYSLNDLLNAELCHKICYPIDRYFSDRCANDQDLVWSDCIGISIVYDHQLLPALHLTRLIKEQWPEKLVLLGGTSISQCFKYLKDKTLMKRFFSVCDGIVVGEGETATCEIAATRGDLPHGRIPNLITYDRKLDTLHLPQAIHYEKLPSLGAPAYEYPWDLYLSPERGINYSPTRGCYWNRCTFCDYGLNTDKPTSPWRERPIDMVIEDLKNISNQQKVKYVYFAVDVMAPGYLERLSDAIGDSDLEIWWGAELRMEKIFSKDRCKKMANSGCVAVSFGMESGNQRVLDLIDKGTKVAYMGETMKNFAEAGIAVQLMAFSHFPTETEAERKQTVGFVELHKDSWSGGGIGKFVLTGTALVAKNPQKFGVNLIEPQKADIVRVLGYEMTEEGKRQMLSAEEGDDSFDESGGLFPSALGRPWAGGTDTIHSMIYYETYGRNFFKDHSLKKPAQNSSQRDKDEILASPVLLRGRLAQADFDISKIVEGRGQLLDYLKKLNQAAIESTWQDFAKWQQSIPEVIRQEKRSCWIIQDNKCLRIPELVYAVLQQAADAALPVQALLSEFSSSVQERLMEHLVWLYHKGYILFGEAREHHIYAPHAVAC